MADELGSNRPALVTQVQPAGTSSKVLGEIGDEVQEGAHVSPSRFFLNNVNFSRHDPLVEKARAAGYKITDHPSQEPSVLVAIPVAFPASVAYRKVELPNGEVGEVSFETAVDQLERYKRLMTHYVQHNCSITIYFEEKEIAAIVDWLYHNWDNYIGVSFLPRPDPTKTAQELGFDYLPQEPISEEHFLAYSASLAEIDLSDDKEQDGLAELTTCSTGACPIK
jgi:adenosylcobalamin-dependent ribonucleoside-triphosphate reductase